MRHRRVDRARHLAAIVALAVGVAAPAAASAAVVLESVLTGLSRPVFVVAAPDARNRLFIVEQGGVIKVLQAGASAPTVFLDIKGLVATAGGEQGLLGLAFHPDFAANRRFFVSFTRKGDGAVVVAEYKASATTPDVAIKNRRRIIAIPHTLATNHNGGWIGFGPDGFLYITVGDGGSSNDPRDNAQNPDSLLGKILRIDVDRRAPSKAYAPPPDNPFVGSAGLDEIFALGFRNPWRASFDRVTGALYVGDVGQGAREEIDVVTRGGNYGWRVFEGEQCTGLDPEQCDDPGFTAPVTTYPTHPGNRCAITGGYVYRGTAGTLPAGTYLFADFCSGEIVQLKSGSASTLLDTTLQISSFGEDEAGELYVVDHGGSVHRLVKE